MTDTGFIDTANIDELFGALADETRVGIIVALWRAEATPIPFSQLHDRVGVRDSGQFNYHLDKLMPELIRKRDGGYELTYAGEQVVGAAVAGTYTDADVSIEPITVGDCPNCQGDVEVEYETGYMTIGCADCSMLLTQTQPAPPILTAFCDRSQLPQVFSRFLTMNARSINSGFCTFCRGPLEKSIDPADPTFDYEAMSEHLRVNCDCLGCGNRLGHFVGWAVIDHPALIGFLFDHGIDLRETPIWELYSVWLGEPHATILDTDPVRVETSVELDGETLTFRLDETMEVIGYRRESG